MLECLSERLEAAGFVRVSHSQAGSSSDSDKPGSPEFFTTWAAFRWKHPDCSVPVSVRLNLRIAYYWRILGRAFLELEMVDALKPGETQGILGTKSYRDSVDVAPVATFESLADWRQHILGYLNLADSEFEVHIQRMVAHLESCTTP
jgi:hypothetical protein